MRRCCIVVLVSMSTAGLMLLPPSPTDCFADTLRKGLPSWFEALDKNGDGEISLREWLQGGKTREEFREFDLNDDGLITAEEVLRVLGNGSLLKLRKGGATYDGQIDPPGKEQFRSKKAYKIFTVTLEQGKTYQIEMVSPVFFAFLYLEGPDGAILARQDSGGNNQKARVVHLAAASGTYRIIATSQGGFRPGAFSLSIRVVPGGGGGGVVVKGLPPWFRELDRDGDGQVSLPEWRLGGKTLKEFREYDLNDDGLITLEEALQAARSRAHLKLEEGRAQYDGALEATDDEKFRGLKYSKIFTVELKAGATYQFDHTSKAFRPLVALEDPDGKIAAFGNNGGKGPSVRMVHQAARTGTYRVIATSQNGSKAGAFSLSVRLLGGAGTLPKGLPSWFEDLDKNQDGEISLREWLRGGKTREEFREFDLNDDGLITAEEVLRIVARASLLKLVKGQASYSGALEAGTGEKYQGNKLAKILTVKLEAGKTYQIDHMSKAFDAYLYLEGPGGGLLAKDDDSGGNLNARIVHQATQTGTYRIIATSLGGNGLGAFTLSVRVLDGSGGSGP
jgi:Ca2+-binding EF-hand superfamily protein